MAHPSLPDTPFCIVCGNPDFASFEQGMTTFEICPCCGCQSGYSYDAKSDLQHISDLRTHWLNEENAAWWSSSTPSPKGWSATDQLSRAGLVQVPPQPVNETSNL